MYSFELSRRSTAPRTACCCPSSKSPSTSFLLLDVREHRHQPHAEVDVGQLHADKHHRPVPLGHVQRDLAG